jgi:hypothetical protein
MGRLEGREGENGKWTYGIFELGIDFRDDFPHLLQLGKHVFLWCASSKH